MISSYCTFFSLTRSHKILYARTCFRVMRCRRVLLVSYFEESADVVRTHHLVVVISEPVISV